MNSSSSAPGKSLSTTPNYPPPAPSGPTPPTFDSSRRPGPGPSGPAAAQSMPRKNQGARKQHKNQRRPGLGDRSTMLDSEDSLAELRAVRNPNSRRGQTSITHLLNYSTPRPFQDHGHHHHHPRSYRRYPTSGQGSGYHAMDKARYVHANYRFVVSPEGSYAKQAADADIYLDWSHVLQVIASTESQATSCPICLSEPVAPRMARCGHIFCLPCLIRFMNSTSSDDEAKSGKGARWKKCPICEDTVYLHETRPARFYAGQESSLPRVGDDVILRLMARNANSTLALPKEGGSEVLNSGEDIPWHFAANVLDYARVMKGTKDYMFEQYDEEIQALEKQEKEDETLYGQDSEWTQRAIKAVHASKEKIEPLSSVEQVQSAPKAAASKASKEADFYFYSTPPHLYLSPLDIRILKTKYGSFAAFPSTLLPRVEHISTGHVVDDAMRKRAKYLGHLPHGCIVSFLECDWTDIVPAETLASFADEIGRRRKRNRDKAAQEDRERIDAERVEAAALRSSTHTHINFSAVEDDRVPALDMAEFQPLNSGTTPPEARTGFDSLAAMSTSPSSHRTVWGTRAIATSPELVAYRPSNVDDGWLRDDDLFDTSELTAQIDAIHEAEAVEKEEPKPAAANGNAGGGGKKKKKQKITLMSTGGRRGM